MAGQKHILLLNECSKRALPSLGVKEKERLAEKREFLRAGLWDAGVRVKNLKGSSGRVVFEARYSRPDRMLFTLGRKGSQTAVYLWGLIGHDEVNRTARRVLPEKKSPFLDFFPENEEEHPLKEFEALLRNHRLYSRYHAELVWEEVRSIIKGAKPMLRLERLRSLSQWTLFEDREEKL